MKIVSNRYKLIQLLGRGGSSEVYLAWDELLNVARALKILQPKEHSKPWRERFLTEARIMARLAHPAILKIYDFGVEETQSWLVLQFAPGGSLEDRLQTSGPLSETAALRYAIALLPGLARAHDAGIIHRDIKPANILLNAADQPLLADFGVARLPALRRTSGGEVMGTAIFMPPEQRLDSSLVLPSADLYSLGASLYQLITGNTPVDLCYAAADSPRWSGLSDSVRSTLRRAMALEPAHRYGDTEAMRIALTDALPGARLTPYTPAADAAPQVPDHAASHAPTVSEATTLLHTSRLPPRHRILLVEDNATIAQAIRDLPWPDDVEVAHFSSGSALLATASPPPASVILLDVYMPGLDGLETLTRLRDHPLYASTPIVMLTHVETEETIVRAFDLGADGYVAKPFSPARLMARINRILLREPRWPDG